MTKIYLKAELASIEIGLESEDYERVFRKLEKLNKIDKIEKDPEYYLLEYFWGQAIFRKEMSRKTVREKKINLAIKHLSKALSVNAKYVDAHLPMGLILIVKAKCLGMKKETFKTAKEHFEICINNGNYSQQIYRQERIDNIDNVTNEMA